MENKNKKSSLFSYFSYLYFAVIFLMSAYITYKNLALGIGSFLVLIVLVLIYINKKKTDLKRWRDRVQSASFNFDKEVPTQPTYPPMYLGNGWYHILG